jgi:hypothetical protein
MLQSIDSNTGRLRQHLKHKIHKAIKAATAGAIERVPDVFDKWTCEVDNAHTWKAICRKGGIHTSKPKSNDRNQNSPVVHRWNEDLAAELADLLDNDLRKYVEEVLPQLLGDHTSEFMSSIKEFTTSVKGSCLGITKNIANTLENYLYSVQRKEISMRQEASGRYTEAINESRKWDFGILTRIQLDMKPGYAKAFNPGGNHSSHPKLTTFPFAIGH